MLVNSFEGLCTSDHLIRKLCIEFVAKGKSQISINVMTWNMLSKCISKESRQGGNKSNNPLNYEETQDAYLIRKRKQFQQISAELADLDFVFLQEYDWRENKTLSDEFENMIAQQGFRALYFYQLADIPCVEMIILYKHAKFSHESDFDQFFYKNPDDYFPHHRAVKCRFRRLRSKKTLELMNVHLRSGTKNVEEFFSNVLQQQIQNNVMTLIGGDFNRAMRMGLVSAEHASMFSASHAGEFTTSYQLPNGLEFNKVYDTFLVCPDKGSFSRYLDLSSHFFYIENGEVFMGTYTPDTCPSKTLTGSTLTHNKLLNKLKVLERKIEDSSELNHRTLGWYQASADYLQMLKANQKRIPLGAIKSTLFFHECLSDMQPEITNPIFDELQSASKDMI